MNHFNYPLTIVQINIFEEPQISFPNQNPRPETIEPAPRIFNYRIPPWEKETEHNYVKTGPANLIFEMENGPKHLFLRQKKVQKEKCFHCHLSVGSIFPLINVHSTRPHINVSCIVISFYIFAFIYRSFLLIWYKE